MSQPNSRPIPNPPEIWRIPTSNFLLTNLTSMAEKPRCPEEVDRRQQTIIVVEEKPDGTQKQFVGWPSSLIYLQDLARSLSGSAPVPGHQS